MSLTDFDKDNIDPSLQDDFTRDGFIYDIYDGDTAYYHANLGYDTWAAFQTGRLLNVWAPEIRPLKTRAVATVSRDALWDLVRNYALNRNDPETVQRIGWHLRVRSLRAHNKWFRKVPLPDKGKYGRWLIELFGADDSGNVVNLNEMMVEGGYATKDP